MGNMEPVIAFLTASSTTLANVPGTGLVPSVLNISCAACVSGVSGTGRTTDNEANVVGSTRRPKGMGCSGATGSEETGSGIRRCHCEAGNLWEGRNTRTTLAHTHFQGDTRNGSCGPGYAGPCRKSGKVVLISHSPTFKEGRGSRSRCLPSPSKHRLALKYSISA